MSRFFNKFKYFTIGATLWYINAPTVNCIIYHSLGSIINSKMNNDKQLFRTINCKQYVVNEYFIHNNSIIHKYNLTPFEKKLEAAEIIFTVIFKYPYFPVSHTLLHIILNSFDYNYVKFYFSSLFDSIISIPCFLHHVFAIYVFYNNKYTQIQQNYIKYLKTNN